MATPRKPRESQGAAPAAGGHPEPVQRLVEAFARLPGVGRRTAERLAFHILKGSKTEADELSNAIEQVKSQVKSQVMRVQEGSVTSSRWPKAQERAAHASRAPRVQHSRARRGRDCSAHTVVEVADQGNVRVEFVPLTIEYVVQVEVEQQWRQRSALA